MRWRLHLKLVNQLHLAQFIYLRPTMKRASAAFETSRAIHLLPFLAIGDIMRRLCPHVETLIKIVSRSITTCILNLTVGTSSSFCSTIAIFKIAVFDPNQVNRWNSCGNFLRLSPCFFAGSLLAGLDVKRDFLTLLYGGLKTRL